MSSWTGVDLDGTLAYYDSGHNIQNIGEPIPLMADRVRKMLSEGKEVRIFTARASVPELIPPVQDWTEKHFGVRLPVTCCKDFGMMTLYDDRCVQVEPNTGRILGKE